MHIYRAVKTVANKILLIICLVIIMKMYFMQNYIQYTKLDTSSIIKAKSRKLLVTDDSVLSRIQYNRYLQLREKYRNRIAASSRVTFGPRDQHIDTGRPIETILKDIPGFTNHSSQPKLILLWTTFYGNEHWVPQTNFKYCQGIIPCNVTTNKAEISRSDGILIHPRDLENLSRNALPTFRLPHQRWIYFIQEPPWAVGINVRDFNGIFNWTATYRRDAEFNFGYGGRKKSGNVLPIRSYRKYFRDTLETKTKLVAARISNCDAIRSNRLSYIKELGKHVKVVFYGKCGDHECNEPGDTGCKKEMAQYKFFLAFENSNCRNYITEKIWRALVDWKSVPVVMGGSDPSDYEDGVPPNSYIHVDGFDSPKELAEYLKLLDKNDTLYERYFRWVRKYDTEPENGWCQMCRSLYDRTLPIQTYRNFSGWYNEDICKQPE